MLLSPATAVNTQAPMEPLRDRLIAERERVHAQIDEDRLDREMEYYFPCDCGDLECGECSPLAESPYLWQDLDDPGVAEDLAEWSRICDSLNRRYLLPKAVEKAGWIHELIYENRAIRMHRRCQK